MAQAERSVQRRDALLDRAAFYLLWQGGLRLGEVEELRLEDLDLAGRKLMVRQGKGLKDRTVYLTDAAVRALRGLPGRARHGPNRPRLPVPQPAGAQGPDPRPRLKAAGERVGVKVLRRTACATPAPRSLLNAGCRVTSIQKFLGHKRLNSTMIYARVHDQTVADDYYAAMKRVEQRLELTGVEDTSVPPVGESERKQLLVLTEKLVEPELSLKRRAWSWPRLCVTC